jgi:lysophospholipase L1-like esterase
MNLRGLLGGSIIAALVFILNATSGAAHAQEFALHDGDRVVFYGDSITAQRFYTRLTEEFVLTRYPALNVRFWNAGVPGDTVFGGYAGAVPQRVERDVAPLHPTMITIMLGMNDGGWGYTPPAKMHADFQQGYTILLNSLRQAAPAASFTFINPTPYDEVTHGTEFPGYAKLVAQLSADVTRMADADGAGQGAQNGPRVYRSDFQAAVAGALEQARQHDPELAPLLIPDRIHPSEVAHWIMAAELVRAWHIDPTVSEVVLDAKQVAVTAHTRAAVTNLRCGATGCSWETLEEALPLPLDFNNALTGVMLRASNVAALDQETLTVRGLERGNYQLLVDTKPVGRWTGDELGHGVNLALINTPMLDQARGLDGLEDRRMALDQARFILLADVKGGGAEVKGSASTAGAQATLSNAADELADQMRDKATPKAHTFELRRQ